MRARQVAQMRGQRGALEVGQHTSDGVAPPGREGLAQCALGADEHGARDHKLGHVEVERGLRRPERRRGEVDQHRPVVDDEHVARVEPAVRDSGRVQKTDLPPELSERVVVHVVRERRARVGRRRGCRVTMTASPSGAEADGDDLRCPDARLRGKERCHRFVLHLLEPPDGRAAGRVAVGEEAPAASEPLGVLGVPAEHSNLQRSPVGVLRRVLGRADPLSCRDRQVAGVDAEPFERGVHPGFRRHPGGGAQRKPHEGSSTEAEREAGEHVRRRAEIEHHRGERGERDEPASEQAHRDERARARRP